VARLKFSILITLVMSISTTGVHAQSKPRIAVYALDDRTAQTQGMNVGQKVADALIAKLTETGNFQVVDRNYLDQLRKEQNLSLDPRFDGAAAVRIGKLANVQVIVVGQIDSFNANSKKVSTRNPVENKDTTTGVVALKVTVRLLDVSTGTILAAPVASNQQNSVLAETTSSNLVRGGMSHSSGDSDTREALLKLVDKTIEVVASQIASQIKVNNAPAAAPLVSAKVIGIDNGLVLINKGSAAGVKMGDSFEIFKRIDTGLKDPDTNAPVLRRVKLCTMAITEVDLTFASGKCSSSQPPASGDEASRVGAQD